MVVPKRRAPLEARPGPIATCQVEGATHGLCAGFDAHEAEPPRGAPEPASVVDYLDHRLTANLNHDAYPGGVSVADNVRQRLAGDGDQVLAEIARDVIVDSSDEADIRGEAEACCHR